MASSTVTIGQKYSFTNLDSTRISARSHGSARRSAGSGKTSSRYQLMTWIRAPRARHGRGWAPCLRAERLEPGRVVLPLAVVRPAVLEGEAFSNAQQRGERVGHGADVVELKRPLSGARAGSGQVAIRGRGGARPFRQRLRARDHDVHQPAKRGDVASSMPSVSALLRSTTSATMRGLKLAAGGGELDLDFVPAWSRPFATARNTSLTRSHLGTTSSSSSSARAMVCRAMTQSERNVSCRGSRRISSRSNGSQMGSRNDKIVADEFGSGAAKLEAVPILLQNETFNSSRTQDGCRGSALVPVQSVFFTLLAENEEIAEEGS